MYMPPVRVRTNYVGVTPLEEAFSQLAAYEICFLRSYFAGLERLTYVVRNHARSLAPRAQRVLTFRECELSRDELRCASVGVD